LLSLYLRTPAALCAPHVLSAAAVPSDRVPILFIFNF